MRKKFYNITELVEILEKKDPYKKKINNHTIRNWESKIKIMKPDKHINGRRYYTHEKLELIRFIKYLIKEKKITLNKVNKILEIQKIKLDGENVLSINNQHYKVYFTRRIKYLMQQLIKVKNK